MCLTAHDNKDLYHIALSVAKYIAFILKYIAQACLYIAKYNVGVRKSTVEESCKGVFVPSFEGRCHGKS